VGTPYEVRARGKILFLEDVGEALYRLDRMALQLLSSRSLAGVRAIVLGNFKACADVVPSVLKRPPPAGVSLRHPPPEELEPLRPLIPDVAGIEAIFAPIARARKIPVAYGLPVGHGPEKFPLPLGATHELTPQGELRLHAWSWRA
jgi:muramoyltetrapeptide carboxypeptidase LdcA involved in peptidoglycan recycling